MKATGIVRRIDELGRIVLPIELRRTLKIREGDCLEIFCTDDGNILLKKYSALVSEQEHSSATARAISDATGHAVIVFDGDSVIASAGLGKRDPVGTPVPASVSALVKKRKALILPDSVADDFESDFEHRMLIPLIHNGDLLGGILALSKRTPFGDNDLSLYTAFAEFLKYYL